MKDLQSELQNWILYQRGYMPNIQKGMMNKGLKEILMIKPIGKFYCIESLCLLSLHI